jgi:hypothetical protein
MAASSPTLYGDHFMRTRERKAMPRQSLDDPGYRAFAWARYWRILRGMTVLALVAVPVSLGALYWGGGAFPLHMGIAVGLAVFFSLLLGAALMGLVFLSSGSQHDEEAGERFKRKDL